MAPKRYTKRSGTRRAKKRSYKKPRRGTMRSFSALAPPRYEKKFKDTPLNAAMLEFSTAGVVQNSFVTMQGGSDNGERIGNRITVTNINAHLCAITGTNASNPGLDNTVVRVILGIDKQCNGANTVIGDVLQSASPYAFRNMYTLNRFVILKDKLFVMDPQVYVSTPNVSQVGRVLKFSWKGQLPIMYSDNTASIGNIETNNIFLLVVTDRTATAGQTDGMVGTVRVKYTDA